MTEHQPILSKLTAIACIALILPATAAVTIDWVPIGNPNNADDSTGYGAVAYTYLISRNETTIAQYTAFLNAVAASDPYDLYDASMTDTSIAGITRNGTDGSYTYSVIGTGDRPITYVSWFDAARFANWMHNGQGSGSTETGAYTLNTETTGIFTKNPDAKFWIPSADEWYKAAFYDPTLNGGTGGYWTYPTKSNTLAGNTVNTASSANYWDGNFASDQNSLPSNLTPVGAYGPDSQSYYGTNDQGGNVAEWNDEIDSIFRGQRGGSWFSYNLGLSSLYPGSSFPTAQSAEVGFRLAGANSTAIPEPTTALSLATLLSASLSLRHRRKR